MIIERINKVFDIPIEFIEHSLEQGIKICKGEIISYSGDLKSIHFIGASLCLDTENEFGETFAIVLNYDSEMFFNLVGPKVKRILTIKAIKLLDELMNICEVNKEAKFWLN